MKRKIISTLIIIACLISVPLYIKPIDTYTLAHMYMVTDTSELSVSVLKEFNRGVVVGRLLRINNITVPLAGLNTWKNITWNDTRGNQMSFDAEWAKIGVDYTFEVVSSDSTIEIDSQAFYRYWNESCHLLFMSKYNGTHFAQTILVLNATSNFTVTQMEEHIQDGEYDYLSGGIVNFSGAIEVNRTTYFVNTTDDIYNPARALYTAVLAMRAHNYTFMSVESIFLVPQELIPRRFNTTAQFLWYIRFNYYGSQPPDNTTTSSTDADYSYEFRAVVFPNGTLLRLDKEGGPIAYFCEGCENTLYVIIIAIVIIVLASVTLIILWRIKKREKLLNKTHKQ